MKKIMMGLMVLLSFSLFISAEEGMWMLSQLKNLELAKKGITVSVDDIYNPTKPCITDAVVLLGGGTAEFVSSQGLLLTNHHVAYGAVQRASTGGTDFLTNGFLARTNAEEIEAPGYSAEVLQSFQDVTADFVAFDKILDVVKRNKAIDLKMKEMEEKIEKGKTDISATIGKMFNGKQYILYVHKRFDDVRVVYVPPLSVGNYGGEIDNFMWTRHTGDFSFMRVYMAPDGTGRKYDKTNVPYKPKFWLKLPTEPLKEGDQTFIIGYPGNTTRYLTAATVDEWFNHTYPDRIKLMKEVIDLNDKFAGDSMIAKMKVAGLTKGLNNAMKNYQGNVDGMLRTNFLQKKLDYENELMAFLKKDPKLFAQYGDVLDKIKLQHDEMAKTRERDNVFGIAARLMGTIPSTASWFYITAREREKPLKLQDANFSETDNKRFVSRLQFTYMAVYEPADKAMMVKGLKMVAALPEGQRIKGLDYIFNDKTKTIEQFVDEAYEKSQFKDVKFAQSLEKKSVKELEALNDPFIQMTKSLYPEREIVRENMRKANNTLDELRRKYVDALYAWHGQNLYPDANRTIRFSLGEVAGYDPRDAVSYKPFTTLQGMLEKDTGKEPFDMPAKLKELYKNKDFGQWSDPVLNTVPIAYTHKVDSTGGNSGSPVLNHKGELVGILFDGNYEAMTGDWQYDDKMQRSISVDIRYVMFIAEKLANAENILKEMGVK